MPIITASLKDESITIMRPIVKSVITQLLHLFNYSSIRDIIYIPRGGHAATKQTENTIEANKLSTEEYLEVEYREDFIDSYRNPDQYQFEFPPVFSIPELGINVRPFCQRASLNIKLKYVSRSYTIIKTWQDIIKQFLLIRNPFYYHDVYYNYTIPDEILAYIRQVYELTETVAPYNRTLSEFTQTYFAKDVLSVRQNLNDSRRALAVNVKNIGCLGQMTDLPDIEETGKSPPRTSSSITYTLEFDLPTALILEYQHYIHNQKIDLQFLQHLHSPIYDGSLHAGVKTFSGVIQNLTYTKQKTLRDPIYTDDRWTVTTPYKNNYPILILPIKVDQLNLKFVLNLYELIKYEFPQPILDILFQFKDIITHLNKGFLYLELFEVGAKETRIGLEIDSEANILTKPDLDLRKRHYFVMYLNTNLGGLDWIRLQENSEPVINLLKFLYPALNVDNVLKTIGGTESTDYKIITKDSITEFVNILRDKEFSPNQPKIQYTPRRSARVEHRVNIRS